MADKSKYIGYKFVKKHSAQVIFTGIFSILLLAIPTIATVFTWIHFSAGENELVFKGYNTFSYFVSLITNRGIPKSTPYYTSVVQYALDNIADKVPANVVELVLGIMPVVIFGLIALQFIFALVLLIMALTCFIGGRLKHFKGPTVISTFLVTFSGLSAFATTCLVVCYKVFVKAGTSYSFHAWWYCWALFGAALIFRIVIAAIYEYGIYDHIYVRDNFQKASLEEREIENKNEEIENGNEKTFTPDTEVVRIIRQQKIKLVKRDVGLSPNITNIGGHDYAENTALTIAIIPQGITKIGQSAFANCINLKSVSIPSSVTEIAANAFFNCVKLTKINYDGTKENWRNIKRGSNWLTKAGTQIVVCTDGAIIVNPYR